MCPPVPPAAIITRISIFKSAPPQTSAWRSHVQLLSLTQLRRCFLKQSNVERSTRVLRNIEQDADRGECRHERRSAVRNKRERNSLRRHQRKHDTNIKERLRDDARHDSQTQQHPEAIRREQRGAHTAPEKKCKHRNDSERADQSELFANDCEDEVRVCKRKKQHLLFALREAETVRAARSDRDKRLHDLKARAVLIGPRIHKRYQTFQSPRN